MQEDSQAFMERFIRARGVAPLDPDVPGLPPQERRDWWEFCLEMHEYFGNLIRDHESLGIARERAHDLGRLQWICLQGSYVFASADPALRAEQRRFADIFGWMDGAFAGAVNDSDGVLEMCKRVLGPRQNVVAMADALRSLEWTRADSPSRILLEAAQHQSTDLREMMLSASGVGPTTSWPTREDIQRMFDEALANGRQQIHIESLQFPDQWAPRRDLIAGVTAYCDLETAFDHAGLTLNGRRAAYAKLQGIPREEAPGELNMSKREVQAGWKDLNRKEKLIRDALKRKVE